MPPRAISASTRHTRSGGKLASGGKSLDGAPRVVNAVRSARSSRNSVGVRSPAGEVIAPASSEERHQVAAFAVDGRVGLRHVEGDDALERLGELGARLGVLAVERFRRDVPVARDLRDPALFLEDESQELDAPERGRALGPRALPLFLGGLAHDRRRPGTVEGARGGLAVRRHAVGLEGGGPWLVDLPRARLLGAERDVAHRAEEVGAETLAPTRAVPDEHALFPQALDENFLHRVLQLRFRDAALPARVQVRAGDGEGALHEPVASGGIPVVGALYERPA